MVLAEVWQWDACERNKFYSIVGTLRRNLDNATGGVEKSIFRLSSGMRINTASDDAAGLAVSSELNVRSRVFNQAVKNVSDAVSALNIAQGALEALTTISIRQKEIVAQAANGVYSTEQRRALGRERSIIELLRQPVLTEEIY